MYITYSTLFPFVHLNNKLSPFHHLYNFYRLLLPLEYIATFSSLLCNFTGFLLPLEYTATFSSLCLTFTAFGIFSSSQCKGTKGMKG